MNQQDLLDRYRLALQLIPDHDVAGDLFMEARDEAGLRRLAARWRRKHGLTPEPEPGPLPDLTPDQEADALHLARRGTLRRRFRRGLTGLGTALLIAAVALGGLRMAATSRPIGVTAFQQEPIGLAELGPYQAAIYRAEASPGAITIWWGVTGPNLDGNALPELRLTPAGSGEDWAPPVFQDATRTETGQLLGQAVFNVQARSRGEAVVQFQVRGAGRPLTVWAPLTRIAAEPGTRELDVPATERENRLVRVALAPSYTLVRYRAASPQHFIRVEGPRGLLEPVGPPQIISDHEFEAIFGPIPPGSRGNLAVHLEGAAPERTFTQPYATELMEINREGSRVTVQMQFSTFRADPYTVTPQPLTAWPWKPDGAYLNVTGDRAQREARVIYQGEDPIRRRTLWRLETNLPADVPFGDIQVWVPRIRRLPMASFTLNL